jgi:hypothetical protein
LLIGVDPAEINQKTRDLLALLLQGDWPQRLPTSRPSSARGGISTHGANGMLRDANV